jgi:hypothetical protein
MMYLPSGLTVTPLNSIMLLEEVPRIKIGASAIPVPLSGSRPPLE